jgi:hypothetical protein
MISYPTPVLCTPPEHTSHWASQPRHYRWITPPKVPMVNLHRLKASRLPNIFSKQTKSVAVSHPQSTHLSSLPSASLVSTITTPKHTFATMSWMDSWSRPSKHQSVPAPFYLLPGRDTTPYRHSCGRVINSRRKAQPSAKDGRDNKTPAKYCSESCRGRKPGKVDREIEHVFYSSCEVRSPRHSTRAAGEHRSRRKDPLESEQRASRGC